MSSLKRVTPRMVPRSLTNGSPTIRCQAQIYNHLTWHLALFELANEHPERVQALYDQTLAPEVSPGVPMITLCDAASLLWRHDIYGLERPAGSRQAVANLVHASFPGAGLTFADVHCALAYAAAGEYEALERLAAQLQERLAQGKLPAGAVVPTIVTALAAFARDAYDDTVQQLEPVMEQVVRIGGIVLLSGMCMVKPREQEG